MSNQFLYSQAQNQEEELDERGEGEARPIGLDVPESNRARWGFIPFRFP